MSEPFAYWNSLKHGGMLISQSRLIKAFPTEIAALPSWKADKLRRIVQLDGRGSEGAALLDFILQEICGFERSDLLAGDRIGTEWSRRATTGELIKPRRVWTGSHGSALPIFVEKEQRLGIGRGRRTTARVAEWLRAADQKLALVTNFQQWRLIYAGLDFESWVEWDTALWFEEGTPGLQVDAFRILLCKESLEPDEAGELSKLLAAIVDSRKGEAELSASLGERIRRAVELLIQAHAEPLKSLEGSVGNADIYRAATRMVMRLVVVLFAEARELLPLDNPVYFDSYSVKGLVHDLSTHAGGGGERLANRWCGWPRLLALFRLIYNGSPHAMLPVLRYGGGLFQPGDLGAADPILRAVRIFEQTRNCPNDFEVQQLLDFVCQTTVRVQHGRGSIPVKMPIDFSDLSSEYIGILYEGLLDFELRCADGPVVFLNLGDEPALPLDRLKGMDKKSLKDLVDRFKVKAEKVKAADTDGDNAGDDDEAADALDNEEIDEPGGSANPVMEEPALSCDDIRLSVREEAQEWAVRAVIAGKLVPTPKSRKSDALAQFELDVQAKADSLILRLILPGEWFLVRWGGTRKGSGTFYTRPQLAVPTAMRTLLPLANDPPIAEDGTQNDYARPSEWTPKAPGEILGLKVCDPSMGSASFLVAALRYLAECLFASLFLHGWLIQSDDSVKVGTPPNPAPHWLLECIKDLPPSDSEDVIKARLKRLIVERCLYGVDFDALAVELGRLALWVETMDRDLPFEFLDHKLKCGNALIGCWFDRFRDYPLLAWKREGGDKGHKGVHFADGEWTKAIGKKRDGDVKRKMAEYISGQRSMEGLLPLGKAPEAVRDDAETSYIQLTDSQLTDPFQRERNYDDLLADPALQRLKVAFDTWCALWFWPSDQIDIAPLPTAMHGLTEDQVQVLSRVTDEYKFFHWELEFPDVFTKSRSGFDGVIGNPPWETIQLESKEFFSNIDPLYRAYGNREALDRQQEIFRDSKSEEMSWLAYRTKITMLSNYVKCVASPFGDGSNKGETLSLGKGSPVLFANWMKNRDRRQGFADRNHPYSYQGGGKPYTYKMFLELGLALLRPGGQMGFIVPSGVYTDRGTTDIRGVFLNRCKWLWLFGFENREKVFDIHSSFKFCPIIVRKGGATQQIRTAFMRRNVGDWENAENYALDYPAANVRRFSPYSQSILEINSERDLEVLEKIYENSVLLGDEGPGGWGIKYAQGDFNMTSDSTLFPPREQWEAKGYKPDEYGRWIGPDGEVALPLYEGRMIGQFDFSQKGYVSGKGRSAVWRDIPWDNKVIEPQYLMSVDNYASKVDKDGNPKAVRGLKIGFMDIASATNQRTMFASAVFDVPCGHKVPILSRINKFDDPSLLSLTCQLNSFVYDYQLRLRHGGLSLSNYILAETAVIPRTRLSSWFATRAGALAMPSPIFSPTWIALKNIADVDGNRFCPHHVWALSLHERLRARSMLDGLIASLYGLNQPAFSLVMEECDWPSKVASTDDFSRAANAKGFWRIDKELDPELRHTVLSLVAFADLERMVQLNGGDREAGIEAFCSQNNGEGWMLPEFLTLSDYGLGHDERAKHPQPVASRLGPRFLPWQLEQTPEESWAKCEWHARNLLGEEGYEQLMEDIESDRAKRERAQPDAPAPWNELEYSKMLMEIAPDAVAGETDLFGIPVEKDLFGGVVEPRPKKRRG